MTIYSNHTFSYVADLEGIITSRRLTQIAVLDISHIRVQSKSSGADPASAIIQKQEATAVLQLNTHASKLKLSLRRERTLISIPIPLI